MTTIANLTVEVGADIADLTRGLNNASNQIDNFGTNTGNTLDNLGGRFVGLGAKITALTAPVGIAGAAGIKLASDFDSVMAEISARTGIVGADLASISDFALQMGADTAFSGQQAADAFLQLLSSGQSAEEAMATLPAILDAAAASGEDLGQTADTITDIMAAFGIETEYAGDVVDSLAKAAGASSADMASLGQGFGNVGGVANNFGLSMNRTAAILAIFAENGIKGAEAGTNLKSMLLAMSNDTEETVGAWNELGTSLYDSEGNMRDFAVVLDELDAALDELPVEEQNRLMRQLAGSYGITGLTALRSSIGLRDMENTMAGTSSAAEVADARMDTFAGRVDSLRGSIETLAIRAMTPFMDDVLKPMVEDITGVVNAVTDWTQENPELTNTIVAVGAALVTIGPALVGIGTAMTLAAPAVTALGVAFGLLVSPIGLAVAAVAGLGVAYTENLGGIKDFVEDTVLPALNNLDLAGFATALQTGISDAVTDLTTGELDLTTLTTDISASFDTLDFSSISTTMETHFGTIVDGIVTVAGMIFGGPVGLAIGAANLVAGAIESDFLGIGTFLEESGISDAVETALNDVKSTIDGLLTGIFGGGGTSGGTAAADDLATQLGGAELSGPLALFVSDLQTGFQALQDLATTVWNNIEPGFTSIREGIEGFVSAFADTETDGLLRVVTGITAIIGSIVGAAVSVGSDIFGELLEGVGNALPMIGEGISDFITGISRIGEGDVGGGLTSIGDTVTDVFNALLDFQGSEFELPDFSTALEGWRTAFESIPLIVEGIKDRIETALDDVAAGIRRFALDFEATVLQLQMAGTDVQIALGINYDANVAMREDLGEQFDAITFARDLETNINAGLAAGGPIAIDVGSLMEINAGTGDMSLDTLASKIADPTAIQEAVQAAVASGDTESAMALIPLGLTLSDDPVTEMQDLLNVALENGGPEGGMFQALLPMATELGINVDDIVTQFGTALDDAAAAKNYGVTITVDIAVIPGSVAFDAQNLSGAIAGTVGAGVAVGGAGGPVPMLASGGHITSEGLAYLHAGETVLNPQEAAAYNAGQGMGGAPNVVINGNQSIEETLAELRRLGIDLRALASR